MIKKRLFRGALALVVMSSLVVMPAGATDLQTQKANAESEVTSLQTQLNTIMTSLNDLEVQGQKKADEIAKAKTDLAATQEKEAEQYEQMKLRIKYMYEDGDTATIEKIVTSGSFSEMLEQVEYANSIHTYDRDALTSYQETVQQVSDIKTSLESDQAKLQSMQADYETQSNELSTMITQKSAEITNLDGLIQEAAAKVAAEQAAKAAEAAAAQAAQVAQTTPEAGSSGNDDIGGGGGGAIGSGGGGGAQEPSYDVSTGNAVVDRAYGWVGRAEYVWGACSPGAFDCSGFVSYCLTGAYGRLGTTYTFLGWSRVSDPQPGDVAVNENHCGIYIGGGQMIHAATEGVGVIVGPVQGGMVYVRY